MEIEVGDFIRSNDGYIAKIIKIQKGKRDIKLYHYNTQLASEHYAQIVLNLIQKQEKIIDKMAEQLAGLAIWNDNIQEPLILGDKEEVKEYFKKEVEIECEK